jgi:hypothetical protein
MSSALTDRNKALLGAESCATTSSITSLRAALAANNITASHILGEDSIGLLNPRQREYLGYVNKLPRRCSPSSTIFDLATIDEDALELEISEVDVEATMRGDRRAGSAGRKFDRRADRRHGRCRRFPATPNARSCSPSNAIDFRVRRVMLPGGAIPKSSSVTDRGHFAQPRTHRSL